MQQLTDEGRRIVDGMAQRHGFSTDAVTAMLLAMSAGYGQQAQFNHPEFGGMGQWSYGGMIMIGDMFNTYLKGRVSSLCQDLSGLIQGQSLFAMPAQSQNQSQGGGWQGQFGGNSQQQSSGGGSGSSLFVADARNSNWWPADCGIAGSTGAQNSLRYAYFPAARRLAIDNNGQVTVYDTGDHQIGGFGQQQGGDQSLTFTSQFGLVRVADLPLINTTNTMAAAVATTLPDAGQGSFSPAQAQVFDTPSFNAQPAGMLAQAVPAPNASSAGAPPSVFNRAAGPSPTAPDELFSLIEKLADLHKKGILTDSEFETKKADLLSRL
jgi:hypothetical protein